MKKFVALFVVMVMMIGVVGCGSTSSSSTENQLVRVYSRLGAGDAGESMSYTLTDKAKEFLTNHEDMFPWTANTLDIAIDESLVDYDFDYRQMLKNTTKFGDKLIFLPEGYLNQIHETEIEDDVYLTEMYVFTEDEQAYVVLFLGESIDELLGKEMISVYGLPLDTSHYDNTSGGQTNVIVLAGSKVAKLQ